MSKINKMIAEKYRNTARLLAQAGFTRLPFYNCGRKGCFLSIECN